jgi:hypothetical protein
LEPTFGWKIPASNNMSKITPATDITATVTRRALRMTLRYPTCDEPDGLRDDEPGSVGAGSSVESVPAMIFLEIKQNW